MKVPGEEDVVRSTSTPVRVELSDHTTLKKGNFFAQRCQP
jgi:hypothetical protein